MNVLSLFDGKSGAMAALRSIGIKPDNYYACEIDKYSQQVSRFHYPDIIRLGDVTKVSFMGLPKIDLLVAGFPCQAFSFAGKQLNFEDPRGKLFFEVVRLLQEIQPKFFLLENVRMKKDIEEEINKLVGVRPVLLNSARLGAQNRLRNYWCGGYKDGKVYQIDIPTPEDMGILLKDIIEEGESDREKSLTVTTRISGATEDRYLNKSMHQMIKVANVNPSGNGMNGNVFSTEGKCPTLTTNKGEGIKITGGAQRGRYLVDGKRADISVESMAGLTEQRIEIRNDVKSNCLTTVQKDSLCIQVGNAGITNRRRDDAVYSIVGKNPTLMAMSGGQKEPKISTDNLTWRKLTVKECCRLQNYPDNYCDFGVDEKGKQVVISKSQGYKMLGNGFDRAMIAHCLKHILKEVTK